MQIGRTIEKVRSRQKSRVSTSKNLKELKRAQDFGEFVKDVADIKRRLHVLETRSDDRPAHLSGNVRDDKDSQAGARHDLEVRMDKLLSFVDQLELFLNQKESPTPSRLIRDAWNQLDDWGKLRGFAWAVSTAKYLRDRSRYAVGGMSQEPDPEAYAEGILRGLVDEPDPIVPDSGSIARSN